MISKEEIRLIRGTLQMSQEEFGNRIGRTRLTVSNLELGKTKASKELEEKIRMLEVNLKPIQFKDVLEPTHQALNEFVTVIADCGKRLSIGSQNEIMKFAKKLVEIEFNNWKDGSTLSLTKSRNIQTRS